MTNFNNYESATREQRAKQDSELLKREIDFAGRYKVTASENGYTVLESDSHYSDSMNPKGEWLNYYTELKTYKALNSAKKRIEKELSYHFSPKWFGDNATTVVNRLVDSYIA